MTQATTLTESDYSDIQADIEATSPTCAQERAIATVADQFPYTATLLTALAAHLESLGDGKGALLLLEAAGVMAAHEARIV